jgi:sensor histidine kinase YesM
MASEREHARLADELAFLRTYLEIERTRFGDRLRLEESVEAGLEGALVPTLLLQPLVENAIRYAVSPRPAGGTIRLSARRAADQVILEVSDDGPGIREDAPPAGTGFGLHSVRERMRNAGPPHAFEVVSAPESGTRVRITLPLTRPPDSASAGQGGVS